jgi:hypothetical protein
MNRKRKPKNELSDAQQPDDYAYSISGVLAPKLLTQNFYATPPPVKKQRILKKDL